MHKLRQFLQAESGAITVDWVVVASALTICSVAVVWSIMGNGIATVANKQATNLTGVSVGIVGGNPPGPAP